jgi:hypothetical protein
MDLADEPAEARLGLEEAAAQEPPAERAERVQEPA